MCLEKRKPLGRVMLFVALTFSIDANAQLTPRHHVTQYGDIAICGNTLVQLNSPNIPAPIIGNVTYGGAESLLFWRSNFPAPGQATANSLITAEEARSQAMLFMPSNVFVTYARLYWGAFGSTSTPDSVVELSREGGFTEVVTADATFSLPGNRYQCTADVTAIVQAQRHGPYQVGGVDCVRTLGPLGTPFCGWSLFVVYLSPNKSIREIVLFDGFEQVTNGASSVTTIARSFPMNLTDAELVVFAYGGDEQAFDGLTLNGRTFASGENSSYNMFNSTRSRPFVTNGTLPGDLPYLTGEEGSMSGIDLDQHYVQPIIEPGATTEIIEATTNLDLYALGYLAISVTVVASPQGGCVGDADGDGDRDFADISSVLANFGRVGPPFRPGDADGNGFVRSDDITSVISNFGLPCPTR